MAGLQASRAAFNAQIDRVRAALQRVFGSSAGPALASLERIRAQGNANFAAAIARCPGAPTGA